MQRRYKVLATTVLFIFMVNSASAQISFLRTDIESLIGTTIESQSFNGDQGQDAAIQALIDKTGANQTWDFTSLAYGAGESGSVNFVALPADLPGSNDPRVANANYATQISISGKRGADQAIGYFQITDTEHLFYGSYSTQGADTFDLLYDQGQLTQPIPMTFNDTWTGLATYQVSIQGFTQDVRIETSGIVNGWGMLIVPGQNPISVLRMEVERTMTTTTMGIPFVFQSTGISFISKSATNANITITPPIGGFGTDILTASYSIQSMGGGGTQAPADAPASLSPGPGAIVDTTPNLSWDSVADATSYGVQVATDASFTKSGSFAVIIDETGITGTSYDVTTALDNETTYFWRVRGENSGGEGPWTTAQTFITESAAVQAPADAPGSLDPANNALNVDVDPTLAWATTAGADTYDLQVATDATFTKNGSFTIIVDVTGLTGTSMDVTGLDFNTTYYWRVRGVNAGGAGPWSSSQNFTTVNNVVVEELDDSIPTQFALLGNYPNPFNPQTTIRFDIAIATQVRLSIFDALGREVDVLVAERMNPGRYEYTWEATNRSSGVYLYRLQTSTFSSTGTMQLVK